MKNYMVALLTLILAGSVNADEPGMVKITGDRVSLRAAPDMNAVLMDRAMSGDLLVLKDNSNADWVGVVPPSDVDVWVCSKYIEDGAVLPARLNVRSGPSLNHGVVGEVQRGDTLTVRGEAAEWLRIAPPETTVVWVSRKYAEVIGALRKPVTMIRVEPASEPEAAEMVKSEPVVIVNAVQKPTPSTKIEEDIHGSVQIVETIDQPEVNEVMVAAARTLKLPTTLVPDPDKAQGTKESFSGILRSTDGILSMLVSRDVEPVVVCYVRGNAAQMKAYADLPLRISGRAYWAIGLNMPVIVPVKIQILSPSQN